MTKDEIKQKIDLTRDAMAHPGFVDLEKGWEEELTNLRTSTLDAATNEQELYFRKGAAAVLSRLVHLGQYLDAIEKSLTEDEEDDEDI